MEVHSVPKVKEEESILDNQDIHGGAQDAPDQRIVSEEKGGWAIEGEVVGPSSSQEVGGDGPPVADTDARTPKLAGVPTDGRTISHAADREVDLSHISSDQEFSISPESQFATKGSLQESSSGFLGSLTSVSNIGSSLASKSTSSASLESSEGLHTAEHLAKNRSEADSLTPSEPFTSTTASNSSDSTQKDSSKPPIPKPPPQPLREATRSHSEDNDTIRYSTPDGHSHSTSSNLSISPSRSPETSPMYSNLRSIEASPSVSPGPVLPFSSKSDDEEQYQGSKRASVTPKDRGEPKETNKLVKDWVDGRKMINDYEIIKKLGSGSQGTVKLARKLTTQENVAIKIVRRYPKQTRLGRQESPAEKVKREVAILKKARHENIVSLLEVIDDPEIKKVYLVLEYVERGEIVWNKRTIEEIAQYEMQRVDREKTGEGFDEDSLLEQINMVLAEKREKRKHNQALENTLPQTSRGDELSERPQSSISLYSENQSANLGAEAWNQLPYRELPRSSLHNQSVNDLRAVPLNDLYEQTSAEDQGTPTSSSAFSGNDLAGTMFGSYEPEIPWSTEEVSFYPDDADDGTFNPTGWTAEQEEFLRVPSLTLSQCCDVARDVVVGLGYLHFQEVTHRDIKPANLLWTADYRVKISDFGVSYLGSDKRVKDNEDDPDAASAPPTDDAIELAKTVGTPAFYAPELCDPDLFDTERYPTRPRVTHQIDVWALGVTLYAMIFGRLPFLADTHFEMFEKIAKQEVFISRKRLRAVEDEDRLPLNSNQRPHDVIQYEDVDDDLRDLLQRLLEKDPSKRITIKEAKQHNWILQGLEDRTAWMDATNPAVVSHGEAVKILDQVTAGDVESALAPISLVERFKTGFKRLGSMVRGRDSRKRAESNANESTSSASGTRENVFDREGRRPSLAGNDKIMTMLRHSRENSDHPLSQSTVASPTIEQQYFIQPIPHNEESSSLLQQPGSNSQRPSTVERTISTTESVRTIRPQIVVGTGARTSPIREDAPRVTPVDSTASSSSSLSGIFGPTRQFIKNKIRSKERGNRTSRDNSTQSSRASSIENLTNYEDLHAHSSVAITPAIAEGYGHSTLLREGGSMGPWQQGSSFPQTESLSTSLRSPQGRNEVEYGSQGGDLTPGGHSRSRANTSRFPYILNEDFIGGKQTRSRSLDPTSPLATQIRSPFGGDDHLTSHSSSTQQNSTSSPATTRNDPEEPDPIGIMMSRTETIRANGPQPGIYHSDGGSNNPYGSGDDGFESDEEDDGIVMGGRQ